MYKVMDTVLYGMHGVCIIIEIAERTLGEKSVEYYILRPVYDPRSTIFIPVGSEALTARMRRILSIGEIYALVKTMPDESTIWIDNDNLRGERYRKILSYADQAELVRLIKTLYLHQQTQKEKGKKLHAADARFMKDAEKILFEEFAYVLNIQREQVLPFILEQLPAAEKIAAGS
ncbi:MAG: CarD family transcriptional regulator [Peptococcaceae bacterium]|nr:CarD family transcriptional regulator [Peptococcaceae bacterium]